MHSQRPNRPHRGYEQVPLHPGSDLQKRPNQLQTENQQAELGPRQGAEGVWRLLLHY